MARVKSHSRVTKGDQIFNDVFLRMTHDEQMHLTYLGSIYQVQTDRYTGYVTRSWSSGSWIKYQEYKVQMVRKYKGEAKAVYFQYLLKHEKPIE